MRVHGALILFLVALQGSSIVPAFAGNWQTPGEIQQPKGNWQVPGEIQQPKGTWQTPGQIQQAKGTWQTPKEIQIPKNFKAPITVHDSGCQHRLEIGADVLFEFNKADLNPKAAMSLTVLGRMIRKLGQHPVQVEGHTDAIGTDEYNKSLSERRAETVKQWLVAHSYIEESAPVLGFGKLKPVAPNTLPDGKDNPEGRKKNRRVEVVVDTCK